MTRIRKKEPKPHLVVADTSVLWFKDKAVVVNPEFDSFWDTYAKDFTLELAIPEVVKGEILFQQSTSAVKSMNRATEQLEEISHITERTYSHRITQHEIKDRVEKRFDKWLKSKGGRLVATPINTIKWDALVGRAIWREPPFDFDDRNTDNEKGFRDALILETLIDLCHRDQREIGVAFLCKDSLLRETAEKELGSDGRFQSYESLEHFESYLKLTKQQLTEQFIRSLVRRANEKFYSKDNPNCLYLVHDIPGRVQKDYKEYFEKPDKSEKSPWENLLASSTYGPWQPKDAGKFWISNARFVKIESKTKYFWVNTLYFVRQYRRTPPLAPLLSPPLDRERVLVLPFYITWQANVSSDGRFRNLKLEEINMKGNSFQVATDEQRKWWKLESS